MAVFAHHGRQLRRSIAACSSLAACWAWRLRPPPMAIAPLAADLQPTLTTRQRVELQTRPEACQSCHATINPLGFALERFDASGRLRAAGERPADRRQRLLPDARRPPREIHRRAGAGRVSRRQRRGTQAFVEQLFRYLVKQPVQAYGPRLLASSNRPLPPADIICKSWLWRLPCERPGEGTVV